MSTNHHVLILSRQCPHSYEAHELLKKNKCMDLVKLVFVEDRVIKLPSWVKRVPIMVTNTGMKVSGDDLFWFLSQCLPRQIAPQRTTNPAEMPSSRMTLRSRRSDDPPVADQAPADAGTAEGPEPSSMFGMDTMLSETFSFIGDQQPIATSLNAFKGCANAEEYQHISTPGDNESQSRRGADDSTLDKLVHQRENDVRKYFGKSPSRS